MADLPAQGIGGAAPAQLAETPQFVLHQNPEAPGYIAELSTGSLLRVPSALGEYLRGDRPGNDRLVAAAARAGLAPENLAQRVSVARRGRLSASSVLKVQYEIVHASGDWTTLERIARHINALAFVLGSLVVFAVSLISVVWRGDPVYESTVRPVNLLAFLLVAPAAAITTFVHESAHALMLQRFGHGMRRGGVMLFMFTPSAFCDITPVWLLPRRQRVLVCLAGALTQLGLAGVAFLVGTAVHGAARQVLDLYGAGIAVGAFINLIPFVKFDGYLALISWLDSPNLIAKSKTHFVRWNAELIVTGRNSTPSNPQLYLFGLMCTVTPVLLAIFALASVMGTLSSLGIPGRVFISLALLTVSGALLLQGRAVLRAMTAMGGTRPQKIVAVTVMLALLGIFLAAPVSRSGDAAFYPGRGAEAAVVAVKADQLRDEAMPRDVSLRSRGLWPREIGTAQVSPDSRPCRHDLLEQTPFYVPGVTADGDMRCFEVLPAGTLPDADALARFALPSQPMGLRLYDQAIGIRP